MQKEGEGRIDAWISGLVFIQIRKVFVLTSGFFVSRIYLITDQHYFTLDHLNKAISWSTQISVTSFKTTLVIDTDLRCYGEVEGGYVGNDTQQSDRAALRTCHSIPRLSGRELFLNFT